MIPETSYSPVDFARMLDADEPGTAALMDAQYARQRQGLLDAGVDAETADATVQAQQEAVEVWRVTG